MNDKHSCQTLLKILNEKCGKLSEIREFIHMCLFDSLIGNHDRHGRNIGIIQTGPSVYVLSPTYDNPSYVGIEEDFLLGADLSPKGNISTSLSNEPTLIDYVNEFNSAGHGEITDAFIKKIQSKWSNIINIVETSRLSSKRKTAFINIMRKRKAELG